MPTARELLEQADALMRRNRLAPAPTSAPLADPDDGIPMLTEAIAPPPGDARAAPPASARGLFTELDDVPLLTDAVEEIEAPSILEEPPDIEEPPELDDPAAWTDTLTGAHSILGEDRLELPPRVPASELTSSASSRASVSPFPSGVVERSPEWDAAVAPYQAGTPVIESIDVEAPAVPLEESGAERIVDAGPSMPAAVEPPTGFDDREFEALPREEVQDVSRAQAYDTPPGGDASPDPADEPTVIVTAAPLDTAAGSSTMPADEAATPFEDADASARAALERYDTGAEATLPGVAPRAATPAAPPPDEDDARWSALAEEIRMQVLQRIDLFTDTGLREQLAARLQPIVDRASADLVATINQHVGVLLRAYVAEAIEREIERWRADRP